jgi:hypothetical protein
MAKKKTKTYANTLPDKKVKEMDWEHDETAQELIISEIYTDFDTADDMSNYINMYNEGNEHFRRGFNAAMIWIIGWAMPTLRDMVEEQIQEEKDD